MGRRMGSARFVRFAFFIRMIIAPPNALQRRPAGQSDGSDNLSAIVAADRAFPAAVAELGRSASTHAPDAAAR
jgi:hypothetical protein